MVHRADDDGPQSPSAGEKAAERVLFVARDATERRRALERLRDSEERYRLVTEAFADLAYVFAVRPDGLVLFEWATDSYLRLTGLTRQEVEAGLAVGPRVVPEERERALAFARRVARRGRGSAEFRVQSADGRIRWIRYFSRRLSGSPTDGVIRVFGAGQDVTDRRAAEERAARRTEELATLNAIAAAVADSLDLSRVVAALRAQLKRRIGAPRGTIALLDTESAQFTLKAAWGLTGAQRAAARREPADGPAVAEALRTLRPALHDDCSAAGCDVGPPAGDESAHACVIVPLVAEGAVLGTIRLIGLDRERVDADRMAFFGLLGRQVGAAVRNAALYGSVRRSEEASLRLSRQLMDVQETERAQLARELHDEIGQMLTGLKLTLAAARRAPESAGVAVDRASEIADCLIGQVRNLSLDLRPGPVEDLGLTAAVRWHAERYAALTGVEVRLDISGTPRRLAPRAEIALYRVVQEALTNVARHADVSEARVALDWARASVTATVEDAGCGMRALGSRRWLATGGMAGMQERMRAVGGSIEIVSALGQGTRIAATLSLGEEESKRKPGDIRSAGR